MRHDVLLNGIGHSLDFVGPFGIEAAVRAAGVLPTLVGVLGLAVRPPKCFNRTRVSLTSLLISSLCACCLLSSPLLLCSCSGEFRKR